MMNDMFQVELSEKFLPYFISLPGGNPEETLKIVLSIVLYMMRMIKFGEALELSGQSPAHFNQLFGFLTPELVQEVKAEM